MKHFTAIIRVKLFEQILRIELPELASVPFMDIRICGKLPAAGFLYKKFI
ncbi:hypothetical protein AALD74_15105 [Lachnospiraceae bacterium 48-21]